MIGEESSWSLRVRGRFGRREDVMRLEGRALVIGVRHIVRNGAALGHGTVLCDNLGLTLALGKGRVRHVAHMSRSVRTRAVWRSSGEGAVGALGIQPCRRSLSFSSARRRGGEAQGNAADPQRPCDRCAAPRFDAAGVESAFIREVEKLAARPGDGDEDTDEPRSEEGLESDESGWESARSWSGFDDGDFGGAPLEDADRRPDGGRDGLPRGGEGANARAMRRGRSSR